MGFMTHVPAQWDIWHTCQFYGINNIHARTFNYGIYDTHGPAQRYTWHICQFKEIHDTHASSRGYITHVSARGYTPQTCELKEIHDTRASSRELEYMNTVQVPCNSTGFKFSFWKFPLFFYRFKNIPKLYFYSFTSPLSAIMHRIQIILFL